jgi:hypothetical protein
VPGVPESEHNHNKTLNKLILSAMQGYCNGQLVHTSEAIEACNHVYGKNACQVCMGRAIVQPIK